MIYFSNYFALFFAAGAVIGFLLGYLWRGVARPPAAATADAPCATPVADQPRPDAALAALPGMNDALAGRLAAAGASDLEALRHIGRSHEQVAALADALRLEDFTVRRWVALAGLQSLEGVDVDLANALLRVGMRSTGDLATANADRVQNKLAALNDAESLLAHVPTRAQVVDLIERAAAID
jgi:hypothetical protein